MEEIAVNRIEWKSRIHVADTKKLVLKSFVVFGGGGVGVKFAQTLSKILMSLELKSFEFFSKCYNFWNI